MNWTSSIFPSASEQEIILGRWENQNKNICHKEPRHSCVNFATNLLGIGVNYSVFPGHVGSTPHLLCQQQHLRRNLWSNKNRIIWMHNGKLLTKNHHKGELGFAMGNIFDTYCDISPKNACFKGLNLSCSLSTEEHLILGRERNHNEIFIIKNQDKGESILPLTTNWILTVIHHSIFSGHVDLIWHLQSLPCWVGRRSSIHLGQPSWSIQ